MIRNLVGWPEGFFVQQARHDKTLIGEARKDLATEIRRMIEDEHAPLERVVALCAAIEQAP